MNPASRISIQLADITKLHCDAIVSAANSSLMGGGGVDGAIHRAGGPEILEECKKIVLRQGGCKTGSSVITSAGKLPSKFVIHTVGPVWNGGKSNEELKLKNCYASSLTLAVKNNCRTIAFPNISTGVYRFPKDLAAKITVSTIIEFLQGNDSVEKVFIACFDQENYEYCIKELDQYS